MVVLGVLVVLGILASSNFIDMEGWMAHHRLRSATKQFSFILQAAKMEAIKRNGLCTVTFDQTIDGGERYDLIAYVDSDEDLEYDDDGDGIYDPPDDEVILKRFRFADYEGVELDTSQADGTGVSFSVNDDNKPSMAFTSRGLTRDNGGSFGAGTIHLINNRESTARVIVTNAGSIRTEK